MRDLFREKKLAKQITRDLQFLMGIDDEDIFEIDTINLWDEKENHVPYGINYEVD